ncbi:DUF4087 domain-containing protein [Allorhizobium sp. BGMRC 0089]|uniref:DUF4087 domain-containing protein n=1 Tax=Allorhizobium sonneratiae TaxID=2934936 RepID=UPI002033E126|nr:DUF4087 domain-containing protein [Allorhizobium sonneratiae]MCM2292793.1 DUF4087 domain-containing protein [Allorhizobium sonneratiae]
MRFRFLIATLAFAPALALFTTQGQAAPQKRCGWIVNPTPGNYWLNDAQGSWTILTQGSPDEPDGMDKIGDLSTGQYVRTNGDYGYACACMKVDTLTENGVQRITAIYSFQQLPLKQCQTDTTLGAPQ